MEFKNESWKHDNASEFFADYSGNVSNAHYRELPGSGFDFIVSFRRGESSVTVEALNREQVESVHQVFSKNAEKCKLPDSEESDSEEEKKKPVVFLGHGRSSQWRDLKDHLQDQHGYKIEAYEVGARAGHTIRDILNEMVRKSSFALLVMTGEDRDEDGGMHARENVVHELGLFQGSLGFPRAIALLESGTSEFSNIHGIQQIRFSRGNIREVFGDVLATLRREFEILGDE